MPQTEPTINCQREQSAERSLAPDLARGLMLALIAVANVMIYLIGRPYGYRQHIVEEGLVNHVAAGLVVTLVDGRAYPLFAFLFGYGMVQLSDRQRRRGRTPTAVRRTLRRRSLALIIFGGVHGVLLFSGDILGWYGVVGLVLVALINCPSRTLLRIAAIWLVPAAFVVGLIYAKPPDGLRSFFWSYEVADPAQALALRAVEWLTAPFGLLPVITAALVGIVAARHRVLEEPQNHRRLLRRVAVGGIALSFIGGLPSGLVVGGFVPPPGFAAGWMLAVVHSITGVAGGLGLAAVFGILAARWSGRPSRVISAVAATGRRSLSAYLFQSVIFVSLLTLPFGALGEHLGTATAATLALLVWAMSVFVAAQLDRRGVPGPAERLLRRWAYASSVKD